MNEQKVIFKKVKGLIPYTFKDGCEAYAEELLFRCFKHRNNGYTVYVTGDAWHLDLSVGKDDNEIVLSDQYGISYISFAFIDCGCSEYFKSRLRTFLYSMAISSEIGCGGRGALNEKTHQPTLIDVEQKAELTANVPWPIVVDVPVNNLHPKTLPNLKVYQEPKVTSLI